MLSAVVAKGQTIHFSEDFSGSPLDSGWTIEVVAGDSSVDNWSFSNPGSRDFGQSFSGGKFAIFDDDYNSADGITDTVDLISPAINLQGKNKSKISFFQYFEGGFGGKGQVYFRKNSTDTWQLIYETTTTSASNPDKIGVNLQSILQLAGSNATAQVKFRWIGNDSFWWIIDDIFIYDNPAKDAAAMFTNDLPKGCVVTLKHDLSITVKNFGSGNISKLTFSYQLNNNSIVSDSVDFSSPLNSDSIYTHVFDSLSMPEFKDGYNEIKLWPAEPDGGADEFSINDTIYLSTTVSQISVTTLPFTEDFESGTLPDAMCIDYGSSGNGQVRITDTLVQNGCGNSKLLVMDAKSNANTIDALDLLVDLSSCAKQILSFTYGNINDERDNEDGLYISVDNGGTFTKVYSFDMANTIDTCITVSFDIDSLASTKGLELTETSILRWSHAGNNTIESGNDGFYIDNIKLDLANLDPVDAGIVEITTPDTTFQGPESEVIVRMSNLGPDTLASSQINFQLGTGKVFSEFWGGCLNVGDTTEITLNNVLTTTTLGQQKLCVWTSNPNGLEDLNTTNDTSCINLNITALGIGKLVINKPGIKIYPNPVKDQLYIEYQINSNSEIKIELYNILGKKSYEKTIMGSNEGFYKKLINLPNLNNGTHILVFQSDHEIISRKLFVIK